MLAERKVWLQTFDSNVHTLLIIALDMLKEDTFDIFVYHILQSGIGNSIFPIDREQLNEYEYTISQEILVIILLLLSNNRNYPVGMS